MTKSGKKESKNNGVSMKTYPGGWIKKIVKRKYGKRSDPYLFSPNGQQLRSSVELLYYLKENPQYWGTFDPYEINVESTMKRLDNPNCGTKKVIQFLDSTENITFKNIDLEQLKTEIVKKELKVESPQEKSPELAVKDCVFKVEDVDKNEKINENPKKECNDMISENCDQTMVKIESLRKESPLNVIVEACDQKADKRNPKIKNPKKIYLGTRLKNGVPDLDAPPRLSTGEHPGTSGLGKGGHSLRRCIRR